MEADKNTPVRAQMQAMTVGAKLSWPLERYDYIVNCRTRLQMSTPKRFSSTTKEVEGQVVIERLKDEISVKQ